jgi:hypothetical protein
MKKRRTPKRTRLKKTQLRVTKTVACNYCGDEIKISARHKSTGPYYHNDACEQAWKSEQSGGPILATSKNYHDLEKTKEWRNLSITNMASDIDAHQNMLIERRNKRHRGLGELHTAFSYNHLGEVIYSAVDQKTLTSEEKTQMLHILILRTKLQR